MTLPTVRSVSDEVWQVLAAVANINAFDGDPDIPPYNAADATTHRFWDLNSAGSPVNVHAYLVFHPSPGRAYSDRLSGRASKIAWSCQVTCVGADRSTCLWCADRVRGVLLGRRISIGRITEIGGNESRYPSIDVDVTPHRRYVPLDFGVRTS